MSERKARVGRLGGDYYIPKELEIDKNKKSDECRIKIYGNSIGTTKDIILFWEAIEKNYISILAYEKLIEMYDDDLTIVTSVGPRKVMPGRTLYTNIRTSFMRDFEKYDIADIVSPDDYPLITRINFNSPGWWEVVGEWNIFKQLREYLKERHLRIKDKLFEWNMEKQLEMAEIEAEKLSNDLLKLDITEKMIEQLKSIGLSDIEIRHVVQKCYGNLHLLDPHIDDGKIIDIKIIDEE